MKDGFIKVAAACPELKVADVSFNTEKIIEVINLAEEERAKVLVFPELAITGCTCGDLFLHDVLIEGAKKALTKIVFHSTDKDMLIFVGMPLEVNSAVYDVAAVVNRGALLGFVTKTNFDGRDSKELKRQFKNGPSKVTEINYDGDIVPFGPGIIFKDASYDDFTVTAKIGEDICMSADLNEETANICADLGGFYESAGGRKNLSDILKVTSMQEISGHVFANAGKDESTTDLVFAGECQIYENGKKLNKTDCFRNEIVYSEMDLQRIKFEKKLKNVQRNSEDSIKKPCYFYINQVYTEITRKIDKFPFIPIDKEERNERAEELLTTQSYGLAKRLKHTHGTKAVIGMSGGLDSTLALLVTVRAFDILGLDKKGILAVTMPCFGTTGRTYNNARKMSLLSGASLKEVQIKDAVNIHFNDIDHDPENHNVVYENAQARERTQVLMDLANEIGGMVIGTGDLSELALGWATYNGDHMSMYGVNSDIPKTLVRHLVRYEADRTTDRQLADVLYDVLDTPVSPELLPPKDGNIAQITEDLVGPYELHDFFLYYMLRYGYSPSKIFRLAEIAFEDMYDNVTVLKWLETFSRRFFTQQFKRSCLPDGPKVGSVGISPRCGLKMPSDGCSTLWLEDLGNINLMD